MQTNKLGVVADDVEYVLGKIEKSYDIRFAPNELKGVRTFGELCEIIISKIKLAEENDCTTQQAFYKLRDAITLSKHLESNSVQVNTQLSQIFSRQKRRRQINELEKILGFKLDILRSRYSVTLLLLTIFLISLPELYFNGPFGMTGIFFSILFLRIAVKTGKVFNEKTVGNLAEKMTRENYLRSRRNKYTVNKNEIVKQTESIFISDLATDLKQLNRETIIV